MSALVKRIRKLIDRLVRDGKLKDIRISAAKSDIDVASAILDLAFPRRRSIVIPLYWADPPSQLLRDLYWQARASVTEPGGSRSPTSSSWQRYLRKVSVAYGKLLAEHGIYVEGETDA